MVNLELSRDEFMLCMNSLMDIKVKENLNRVAMDCLISRLPGGESDPEYAELKMRMDTCTSKVAKIQALLESMRKSSGLFENHGEV